ncbi:ISAzo13 family transposase [Verrucomicrobia bacterium LW23]|nr:ISAzo13 family transposase [Verrucomicrobia bacterium LW23]
MDKSFAIAAIARRFELMRGRLDERQIREFAAVEARVWGYGGVHAVARATGLAINTVRRGVADVSQPPGAEGEKGSGRGTRVRQAGAGRRKLRDKDPALVGDLDALVAPFSRGDPMRPLRWTCKSVRQLARELQAMGHSVSPAKVAELLAEEGYSLQSHRKRNEGKGHADRDAQFVYINDQAAAFEKAGQPVISVDTKKKELVGPFKNGGREWRPQGSAEEVNVYDFIDPALGKAIPYGVYDVGLNEAWVSVGCDHDTSEFAVESIRRWWRNMGSVRYPQASKLLITADGGGSNSSRCHLWKWCLSQLSAETGLDITVCHLPPATSKWNKIEHRLFCHITQNWRGKALISHEVIVALIAATTTQAGLKVNAERDASTYNKGIKPTSDQMEAIPLTRAHFHGEWNYTIGRSP